MGSLSTEIFDNDFVLDILSEFNAIFYKYDDKEAISLLNEYASAHLSEDERYDFIYALALFLWQKGRLTDEIKMQALKAIKTDKLALYKEAGNKVLEERKRTLNELSLKIQTPQPKRKKINSKLYPSFCKVGDIITLKLRSSNKYIAIQCVLEEVYFQSEIDKSLKGSYPHFVLLNYYDLKKPGLDIIKDTIPCEYGYDYCEYYLDGKRPIAIEKQQKRKYFFYCEWNERPFKQREYEILGNLPLISQYEKYGNSLDVCNLWRVEDELQIEKCVLSDFKIKAHWQKFTNEDAIIWLRTRNKELYDLWSEYHKKFYQGELPQNQSFVQYAKSLGYWNDDLM